MLLYHTSDNGDDDYSYDENAVAKYVNEALSRGYLTVYIPMTTALSKSIQYDDGDEKNINRGNLLTFDTRTFYNYALAGNMQPFEELKVLVEEAIEEQKRIIASKIRDSDDEEEEEEVIVVLVVGVAAELVRNGKFDESFKLEEWWQKTHSEWLQNGLKVNVLCPHSNSILDKSEIMHHKQALSSLHDVVVDDSGSRQ